MSKLRGGFDALIDFLALCYGPGSIGLKDGGGGGLGFVVTGRLFPPVVERHDAMAWERWRWVAVSLIIEGPFLPQMFVPLVVHPTRSFTF